MSGEPYLNIVDASMSMTLGSNMGCCCSLTLAPPLSLLDTSSAPIELLLPVGGVEKEEGVEGVGGRAPLLFTVKLDSTALLLPLLPLSSLLILKVLLVLLPLLLLLSLLSASLLLLKLLPLLLLLPLSLFVCRDGDSDSSVELRNGMSQVRTSLMPRINPGK